MEGRALKQLVFAAAFALPSPCATKDPLHLSRVLDIAPGVRIAKDFADCPFREPFGEMLTLALHRENAIFAPGRLPASKGRSLRVQLVGFAFSGNGLLGHDTTMRFEGTLYADGKKLASFTDDVRFRTDTMMTACAQLRTNLDAEALQIARRVRRPVDGQELKRRRD